jgi:hypothetical protein
MLRVRWIPAFAGMTGGGFLDGSGFQRPLVGAAFQPQMSGKAHEYWGVLEKAFDADGADDANPRG